MLSAAGLGLAGGLLLSSLGLGKLCGLSVGVLERLPAKLPPEETGVAPHQVGVGHLAEGGGLLLAPSRLRLLLLLLLGRRPMALLATVEPNRRPADCTRAHAGRGRRGGPLLGGGPCAGLHLHCPRAELADRFVIMLVGGEEDPHGY